MGARLRDSDVRRAIHGRLLRQAKSCPDTLVIDELGLGHGACRVDIAVINGHIRGLEIKAEADDLLRLPRQVFAYGQVVDKATLVVASRHREAALAIIPAWWGVIVAERTASGTIGFRRERAEHVNRSTNAMMLARLLWRDEVTALLNSLGVEARVLRAPRAVLYQLLIERLPRRALARVVRDTLRARAKWRDRPRPSQYDGSYLPNATL